MNWAATNKTRVLLAAATLIPIGVLAWLGGRILAQERDVERQRSRESLEIAAGRLSLDIERQLTSIEKQLENGMGLRFTASGLVAGQDLPILYQPEASGAPESYAQSSIIFDEAETEEFLHRNFVAAAEAYRRFAQSPDLRVRGGALLRLARVLRTQGDSADALVAYEKLAELGEMSVEGDPASLFARQGRAKIFEETRATEDLHREARELAHVLYSGGLPVDRATFGVYVDLLERWGAPKPSPEAVARTEAALHLWQLWRAGELSARGRQIRPEQGTPVLAIWEPQAVWLATPDQLQTLLTSAKSQHLSVSISQTDGQPIFGSLQSGALSLTPSETHLPFILNVAALDPVSGQARAVLVTGLILAFSLMIATAYGLYRVTTRELKLARQQSDFVSAVSHEFRTPLTSMRHLTELLARGGIPSEERKQQYYELLAGETERLHRMVEGLLSFGRIEAGAYAWQLEHTDVGKMVHSIVDEFRRDPAAAGREIIIKIAGPLPSARVDREALSRALWNLLENAAKYSKAGTSIRVFARTSQDSLLLGVEDKGVGIPASERGKIFHKFVRGADAKRAGIRGVGIGLALVQGILEAHGGSVQVESEPGRGSTFTLVIPCHES